MNYWTPKLSERQINIYARRLLRGEPIPLFLMKSVNRQIDQRAEQLLKQRSKKVTKNRKTGTFYRGGI